MAKHIDLRPDRTANLDRQLRGAFREIVTGKFVDATQAKGDVKRLSNERGSLITSRNLKSEKKK
ncbi:hypothetical protein M2171_004946 [Bradyrhizobium japonicum USDA 38]|uniref:hypothetical protein n=1 Tax=Bradyrhizobium japonicum TaxID=375 RepID=UPI0012BB5790|nr:hypothetical protein [Bradyrhizobium japonicum]MCS3895813.1 hypothetical protein [Bradyrhizobium japonicum USDA 38]MCS3948328.1 hypothetical protein [Bradyrhizobium japonicum]